MIGITPGNQWGYANQLITSLIIIRGRLIFPLLFGDEKRVRDAALV